MTHDPKPDTPFPRHRYYYIAIKLAILLLAAALVARYFGYW